MQDLDLPPLAVAILNQSEAELIALLAKYPRSIHERTYNMTVLHLSSRWATGLSILLKTSARAMINYACEGRACHPTGSPVQFAATFECEEAVRILLDSGCQWNGFRRCDTSSPSCVRLIAEKLAARRRMLWEMAEEVLEPNDLLSLCPDSESVDFCAVAIINRLRQVGVTIPHDLVVAEDWEGIYLSGNLDITHLSVFYEAGFHDMNRHGKGGQTLLQVISLELCRYRCMNHPDDTLLAPAFLERLRQWGCLDSRLIDPWDFGINTSATGWHVVAARMVREIDYGCSLPWSVLEAHVTDSCDCHCSSAGCTPTTTWIKGSLDFGACECGGHRTEEFCNKSAVWDTLPENMAPELLRFFTFEALEMSHTCCSTGLLDIRGYCPPLQVASIIQFPGDIEEIQEDEEELVERLENLLVEFEARLDKSKESLKDFIWGYWRTRIGEECVPVQNQAVMDSSTTDVILETIC